MRAILLISVFISACAPKVNRKFEEPIYIFRSDECVFTDEFHQMAIPCDLADGMFAMKGESLRKLLEGYLRGDQNDD